MSCFHCICMKSPKACQSTETQILKNGVADPGIIPKLHIGARRAMKDIFCIQPLLHRGWCTLSSMTECLSQFHICFLVHALNNLQKSPNLHRLRVQAVPLSLPWVLFKCDCHSPDWKSEETYETKNIKFYYIKIFTVYNVHVVAWRDECLSPRWGRVLIPSSLGVHFNHILSGEWQSYLSNTYWRDDGTALVNQVWWFLQAI